MTLHATIRDVPGLLAAEVDRLFELMDAHYENVDSARFRADLAAKRWAILLRDREGRIQGFSTLQTYALKDALYLYSGDTLVHPDHWLDGGLVGAFGHVMLRLMEERAGTPLFWFLLSKGFRTYRLLPLHFRTYIPAAGTAADPALEARLEDIAGHLFGKAYDPSTGRIPAGPGKDRLRPELAGIPEHRRQDSHVAFFLARNPAYAAGDELACLASISQENLTPMAWRAIRHTPVAWEEGS